MKTITALILTAILSTSVYAKPKHQQAQPPESKQVAATGMSRFAITSTDENNEVVGCRKEHIRDEFRKLVCKKWEKPNELVPVGRTLVNLQSVPIVKYNDPTTWQLLIYWK